MTETGARRRLLAQLLAREGIALPVAPARGAGARVLSFAQERLWFLDRLQPGSPVYHVARALRLRGRLDRAALGRALDEILRRQEILRAAFPAIDDRPALRIDDHPPASLQLLDWRNGKTRAPSAADLARRLGAEAAAPFDLARGPLLRAKLIALGDNDHALLVVMHQIICDGGSMQRFFGALATLYRAFARGKPAALPELPMQYADYAARERAAFRGAAMRRQLAWWKERLRAGAEGLALPADRPRPSTQSFRGARLALAVPAALARRLKELGARAGATPFAVWMAVFAVLLRRYSGQQDISLGFAASGRRGGECENLIGPFVNTLVLRADFSRDPSFRELLGDIGVQTRAALAHQEAPFDKLVEEFGGQRDLSRNPLFQAMFVYQSYAGGEFSAPGLRAAPIELPVTTAKFDVMLSLTERGGALGGFIEYSADLFEAPTIERMARHFLRLAAGAAADPDRPIPRLPLLSEKERKQVLVAWNRTAARYPKNRCMHEWFEARAARTPRAVAVECGGRRLSYGELERRANRLAHHLRALGVGPERTVGVCLPRSLDLIVALLGILKAGGAYVPLDPGYPRERRRFMLADAQAAVLVTTEKAFEDGGWRPVLSGVEGMEDGDPRSSNVHPRVVYLDRDLQLIARQSEKKLTSGVRAANLAYVIYTSGSSGEPKGVAIEHRNAAAFLSWTRRAFSAREMQGVLASTSICFDLSIFEIFAPLCRGGRVVLVENALAMRNLRRDAGVTLINTVPSALAELLELGAPAASVRTVNLAGEPLPTELVKRIYETGTVQKVYDLYGPSETTTYSTFALRRRDGKPTIGRPIANTKIYLLDDAGEPVPAGVPGEIFIGGAGVARGYLNRPELSAEKFLPDRFARARGARMYRTGDLARYDGAGCLEYLGRADQQVKIRGYRIELGEIEAALRLHPAVRDCAVIARDIAADDSSPCDNRKAETPAERSRRIENPKADRRLVAYVVFKDSLPAASAELRSFLRAKLPEYMVPAFFARLEALPLNRNGKLDRGALPAPESSLAPAGGFVAPRTEIEELIAQVWRAVLKIERIGAHDNFFELGGHSLLAVRAAARLSASFNIELPLRRFFELPTIAQLGAEVEDRRQRRGRGAPAPIAPAPRQAAMPLSFAQRRLWFLHKLEPGLTAYNMPAGHRVKGPLDAGALEKALNEMVGRHEALRAAIGEIDGEPVQRLAAEARLELRVIDLTHLKEPARAQKAAHILDEDALRPFDLARAPLLRAVLLRFARDDHALILNFHHLIADGASLAIFYRELGLLYESARAGKPAALPAPPIQHADFAVWERGWLNSAAAERQLAYWRRQLAGARPLELPADAPRRAPESYRGGRAIRRLPRELSVALRRLGQERGATLFMTLLAALKILLARLAGQEDVVVGSTVAGRNRAELDGVIGFFINALALRTDLSGNPSFAALLERVREVCLDAFTHQELPFERIVEAINPERDRGGNPVFQTLFNMADVSERALCLGGCETVSFGQAAPGAKFDLVLRAPQSSAGLELEILYNADRFSAARMAVFLEQWEAILAQAAAAPEKKLERFALSTEGAKAALPDPAAPLDESWLGPITDFVARQAQARGKKLAVADGRERWRYRELDQTGNRLAHRLIAAGVAPGDRVAIYAEREASLALALVAALKAGAAFVILDPAYPAARLLEYLRIARPKAWIRMAGAPAPARELAAFLAEENVRRIDLPREKKKIARLLQSDAPTALALNIAADDPAYIAFTSGSTGAPKGVLGRHGPMTHFLPWQEKVFGLRAADRYSLLSGLGYNHLQRELFTALAAGATVCVPDAATLRRPGKLLAWLAAQKISVVHLTPALGRLLSAARGKALPAPRRIFFGGDLLSGADVAGARALAPRAAISNFYGATETQRAVGCFVIDPSAPIPDTIPAGKGVKDAQLLVLSAGGQPAGIGELGEIYVRSPHLAGGYLGDPELTRKSFVVNPFTGAPRDRLFRTGELGRYRPDGNVEWAGRRGRRISVRGFRVELAEVEAALRRCRGVRGAAAGARENARGAAPETAIVAYVERDRAAVSGAALRRELQALLPHYMIPAEFFFVERLPLNPSGKIDYARLAALEKSAPAPAREFEAPRSAAERAIAAAFSAVLGVEPIGRRDNFFELGGHSLLAAQAAARIRDLLGVEPELKMFLQAPTPAALARRLEAAPRARAESAEREEIEL